MSHHLFLLSPSDTPLYSLVHYSSKPAQTTSSPLASNLPNLSNWSSSAFAGTFNALSGATSASQAQQAQGGAARIGGGTDRRHVIQMIANASLDAIEEVMRKDSVMFVSISRSALVSSKSQHIMPPMGVTRPCCVRGLLHRSEPCHGGTSGCLHSWLAAMQRCQLLGDTMGQLTHTMHLQVFEICGQVQRVDCICLRDTRKYALIHMV